MTSDLKGPVATEIEARLRAALSPDHLAVIDDSEKHRGHAGHDGSGESHFTVDIVADRFTGPPRRAREIRPAACSPPRRRGGRFPRGHGIG